MDPRLGAITKGKDYNFFNKITVANSTGVFLPEADVFITFPTFTVTFQLESGGPISYSFNGNTVHGDMIVGKSSASLVFENRIAGKIWFMGTGVVRIEAWGTR